MYEVIEAPLVVGKAQEITTLVPLITVVGGVLIVGGDAARIEIAVENTEVP